MIRAYTSILKLSTLSLPYLGFGLVCALDLFVTLIQELVFLTYLSLTYIHVICVLTYLCDILSFCLICVLPYLCLAAFCVNHVNPRSHLAVVTSPSADSDCVAVGDNWGRPHTLLPHHTCPSASQLSHSHSFWPYFLRADIFVAGIKGVCSSIFASCDIFD